MTSVHELIFCICVTPSFGGFIYVAQYCVLAILFTHNHLIIVSNELAASITRAEEGLVTPKRKVACFSERLLTIYIQICSVSYLRRQQS